MKKLSLSLLFMSCLILIGTGRAKASHAVGADLTYNYVNTNQYMVTVKFYRDCTGIDAPPTMMINYNSSCGNGYLNISQVPGTGHEIPTGSYPVVDCYTACQTDPNTGLPGTGYGVQEFVYRGLVTLPAACADWVLSAEINARNPAITTINNPGASTLRVEATLDNLNNAIDSSPVFSTYPVSRFCINNTYYYSQGAVDPEGDSLVFSLVDALDAGGAIVAYISPYTGLNPVSSSPPVTIDPATGLITFSPNQVQVGPIAILVQEYRNGVLIGSVRRDVQVNIEAICQYPPLLSTATTGFNLAPVLCGDSVLNLHLVSAVQCSSVAADGSDFRVVTPSGNPLPCTSEIAFNCVNGYTDSLQIHLYAPYFVENGWYVLYSKVGNDGNKLLGHCDYPMAEYDTAMFYYDNCYHGKVDIQNVTVNNTNDKMEVLWSVPTALPVVQFQSYDIFRSDDPAGPYSYVGNTTSATDTFFVDGSVSVPSHPYSYALQVRLNYGFVSQLGDSLQSIFLNCIPNSDSTILDLNWTPYWGWANPSYQLMFSTDQGASFIPIGNTTTATNIPYVKPTTPGTYYLRVQTQSGGQPNLLSRSNWCRFDVAPKVDSSWVVVAPNIFTPNGDGYNDVFAFDSLFHYPGSRLTVFNRWGKKVYESNDYKNDWNGGDVADGVYFYTMKVANKEATELRGTITIIRYKK